MNKLQGHSPFDRTPFGTCDILAIVNDSFTRVATGSDSDCTKSTWLLSELRADLVKTDVTYNKVVKNLLGTTVIAKSMDEAVPMARALQQRVVP